MLVRVHRAYCRSYEKGTMRVELNNGECSLYDFAIFFLLFSRIHRLFYLVTRAKMGALELSMNHPRLQRWRRRRFDDETHTQSHTHTKQRFERTANMLIEYDSLYAWIQNRDFPHFHEWKMVNNRNTPEITMAREKSRCTAVHCLLYCLFRFFFRFQLCSIWWMLSQNIVLCFYWFNDFL